MKKAILLLLCSLSASALSGQGSLTKAPKGAWLQQGVKWAKAPNDINPRLRFGEAAILYFGADHTFALIYATVNRVRGEYPVISNGDGQIVYVGTWEAHNGTVTASYRLVSRTVRKEGESLPGPIVETRIKSASDILTFDGRSFRRAEPMDKSALTVVNLWVAHISRTLSRPRNY